MWFCFILILQKMWKHPACLLYHINALLIAVQHVTVKRIDYTGISIYIQRFIFNCLEELTLISCQTVHWFSDLLLYESLKSATFCDKWTCSIIKCNYLKKVSRSDINTLPAFWTSDSLPSHNANRPEVLHDSVGWTLLCIVGLLHP